MGIKMSGTIKRVILSIMALLFVRDSIWTICPHMIGIEYVWND